MKRTYTDKEILEWLNAKTKDYLNNECWLQEPRNGIETLREWAEIKMNEE